MKKKTNPYNKITDNVKNHIEKIIKGSYQQAALGTIDKSGYPMVTKIIPMHWSDQIYIMLSNLSEHTKNLMANPRACIYFAEKERHKIKSNNPRLTLQGTLERTILRKDEPKFQTLLNQYSKIESGAKMWAMFTDFDFYIFTENRKLFIEGFGKAFESASEDRFLL